MNGELMAAEINEQPDVFARILVEDATRIRAAAAAVRARKPRFALLVARGTSDHAALYAKYLIETRLGLPAGLVSPSATTIYGARIDARDVLLLAISQSGESPDIIEPVVRAREGGAITVAITNAPGSPVATVAEYHLDILAGPERAVAATKTYTAELLTLFLFINGLRGHGAEEAHTLPEKAREALASDAAVAALSVRYRFAEQLVVTARGYNYPTAREIALKLMETSYLVAHAFSGADLLHGPLAMIDRGFPIIAVIPDGPGGKALLPVLQRLRERGADTLVLGNAEAAALGTVGLELPRDVPEALSPLLAILPMQQFAWHLARLRGGDPDQPRGLQKVTETW